MKVTCPHCGEGFETNPATHTEHDAMCEETLCSVCNHCEFSNGDEAERCMCNQCLCYYINFKRGKGKYNG